MQIRAYSPPSGDAFDAPDSLRHSDANNYPACVGAGISRASCTSRQSSRSSSADNCAADRSITPSSILGQRTPYRLRSSSMHGVHSKPNGPTEPQTCRSPDHPAVGRRTALTHLMRRASTMSARRKAPIVFRGSQVAVLCRLERRSNSSRWSRALETSVESDPRRAPAAGPYAQGPAVVFAPSTVATTSLALPNRVYACANVMKGRSTRK